MIKRVAAISVLAGTILLGGGAVAFAAPPPTPPNSDKSNGATVTNFTCMSTHGHGVVTPSGNISRECHVNPSAG